MSLPGLAVALILTLIAAAVVAQPLLQSKRRARATDESLHQQRDRVGTYYERVLTNIRDLDEDFATGKISEDDFKAEREVWAQRGIRLLRVQDQLDREQSLVDDAADAERIDRAIEEAVAAYRESMQPVDDEHAAGETT